MKWSKHPYRSGAPANSNSPASVHLFDDCSSGKRLKKTIPILIRWDGPAFEEQVAPHILCGTCRIAAVEQWESIKEAVMPLGQLMRAAVEAFGK